MSKYARDKDNNAYNNSGIYCIENKLNGKKYIGQACNLHTRWIRHKSDLNCQNHFNRYLQASWNKYGEENFEFSIIEECSVESLDEREIYWIDYYDVFNNGYNLAEGGIGCRGYKHTDEEIKKMRMIQKPKPIVMLDLQGNYIRSFISTGEAGDFIGKKNVCGIKNAVTKINIKKPMGIYGCIKKTMIITMLTGVTICLQIQTIQRQFFNTMLI